MADGTGIEWCDASWNPLRARRVALPWTAERTGWHCEVVTPGCENCYAASINGRLGTWLPYKRTVRGEVATYLDDKVLQQPLRWRWSRRVFVCSMSDLFGEWVPWEMIDRVFAVMALAKEHVFLVLTKRAGRMREYVGDVGARGEGLCRAAHGLLGGGDPGEAPDWPLGNVHLGVSVEDQRRAEERIPELLETPAALRWVSAEPLLEGVDLSEWLVDPRDVSEFLPGIGWVVVGGESGPGARPFCLWWAEGIIKQCGGRGVPCFVKQVGARPYTWTGPDHDGTVALRLRDRKGGAPAEWPADLRVREYPA